MKIKNILSENLKIKYIKNVFDKNESKDLYENLYNKIKWKNEIHTIWGKKYILNRKTAFYGDHGKRYRYSGNIFRSEKWINDLIFIKKRVESCYPAVFNSVLINEYNNGKIGMGWHSDDEIELGKNPLIASVSFGVERDFILRHKTNKNLNKIKINLQNGSLLLMLGETQHFWSHTLPKRMKVKRSRINLTFRKII